MPKIGMSQIAPLSVRHGYFYQGFNRQYFRKALSIDPQNLIGLWPMWEASGAVAHDLSPQGNHGAYTTATLGQPGIGDGRSCPLFDGANDYNNIYSAGLVADFDGAEGSLLIWAKPISAAVWTDGTTDWIATIRVGSENYIYLRKDLDNNRLGAYYRAGNVLQQRFKDGVTTADWFTFGMTWSAAADEVKAFYNGVQAQATALGLGTWVGDPDAAQTVLCSLNTTPSGPWAGWAAFGMLYKTPLSAQKMLSLAQV